MLKRIENELCWVEISTHAAEIHHMVDKETGIDYIWSGNAEHWANRNPILFPHTGSLPNKQYKYNGKLYTTENHGIARHAEFKWLRCEDNEAELVLESNHELKEISYPFEFKLKVSYTLEGKRLTIRYVVENHDEKELPFEIGMHPAFNVPFTEGKTFEDYCIEFEQEEHVSARVRKGSFELNGTCLDFKEHPFDRFQAAFFAGLKSRYVTLTDHNHALRVGIENMEQTGFWRPNPKAPFVCIEPWYPLSTLKKEDTFKRGKDNCLLPAYESFEFNYYLEIL